MSWTLRLRGPKQLHSCNFVLALERYNHSITQWWKWSIMDESTTIRSHSGGNGCFSEKMLHLKPTTRRDCAT